MRRCDISRRLRRLPVVCVQPPKKQQQHQPSKNRKLLDRSETFYSKDSLGFFGILADVSGTFSEAGQIQEKFITLKALRAADFATNDIRRAANDVAGRSWPTTAGLHQSRYHDNLAMNNW